MSPPMRVMTDSWPAHRQLNPADVAEEVLRLHEVVAGGKIAMVLRRQRVTAHLGIDGHRRSRPQPRGERAVEARHEHTADVVADPFLWHCDHGPAHASAPADRSVTRSPSPNPVSSSRSTMG